MTTGRINQVTDQQDTQAPRPESRSVVSEMSSIDVNLARRDHRHRNDFPIRKF